MDAELDAAFAAAHRWYEEMQQAQERIDKITIGKVSEWAEPIECPECLNRYVYRVRRVAYCPICGWRLPKPPHLR